MTPTPITDHTHRYVAQKTIALCAAYVDKRFDARKTPAINTDELISDVCRYLAIQGTEFQQVYEMREGYVDNPALFT